jgi:hypothetical protein
MKTFLLRLLSLLLLFVGVSSAHARLSCFSSRVIVGGGENNLFASIVVSGDAPKEILIRVFGPTLQQIELSGWLPDPVVHLYDSNGNLVDWNDDWDDVPNAAHVAATMQAATEYSMAWGSPESAILVTLNPGTYTAVVSGKDGATGLAHLDYYETNQYVAERFFTANTRGHIGPGTDSLYTSIIITGNQNKRVLFRALGPQLAEQGVAGALSDPYIELYTQWGSLVACNDDWSNQPNHPTLNAEMHWLGSPLPYFSKDAAVLVELPPGQYIAITYGVNHVTGLCLQEVFELQ